MRTLTGTIELPPSAYATHAAPGASPRYTFANTMEIVRALADEGLTPHSASEVRARKYQGFQRHMIRFRPIDAAQQAVVGGAVSELLFIGSHNRTSALQIRLGAFRFACSNGMVVSVADFGTVRIRHTASIVEIMDGVRAMGAHLGTVSEQINVFQRVMLTHRKQLEFATDALSIRYPERSPIHPDALLMSKRDEDNGDDLWRVFNRVQENLTQGGMQGQFSRPRVVSRIRGLQQDVNVNAGLWDLAASKYAGFR